MNALTEDLICDMAIGRSRQDHGAVLCQAKHHGGADRIARAGKVRSFDG